MADADKLETIVEASEDSVERRQHISELISKAKIASKKVCSVWERWE